MNRTIYLFTLVTIAILHTIECVKVSLYYEALCPDSTRFIARQLYPNYSKLKNYMQLELIPYGKASHNFVNKKWHFECQHGREECKGNKYQSCALAQNNGKDKDVAFVNCVMRERNPSDIRKMEKCAEYVNIDWEKISRCARSDEGDELLAQNGNKTYDLEPNISFVPTVVFNDEYDSNLQDGSLVDFVAVVCSKIEGEKPKMCDNKRIPSIRRSYWNFFNKK